MMKVAVIGAGKSGRGFLARLLANQAEIIFYDKDKAVIEKLRRAGQYNIYSYSGQLLCNVGGYSAYTLEEPSGTAMLGECGMILVSVGGENCPEVGAWLQTHAPVSAQIIACENAAKPASLLVPTLGREAYSGAIFCTTVEAGELDITSEEYPALHTDAHIPLRGFQYEPDFRLLMLRKIYTYNAASGIIAYLGAALGYKNYADAANDPVIDLALDRFYSALNAALCVEYKVDPGSQAEFARRSKRKFQDRDIVDSIARNAASPARKLGPDERLIAPARLIEKHGGDVSVLMRAAAAALHYMDAATPEEAGRILQKISMLKPDEPLYRGILQYFMR